MTPILILLFGFDAKVAVGTDILHGAIFKSFGAVRHRMLGTVHARLALWMLVGSAPLSLSASRSRTRSATSSMTTLQKVVGGALIVGGLGFLAKTFVKGRGDDAPFLLCPRDKADRGRDRRGRRLRRRADLGRLRHVLRPRDAVRLSADRAEDRRHRHVPRGGAALGRRRLAPPPRRRRQARDGLAARRLDPRRADRLAPLGARARARRCGSRSASCSSSRGSSSSACPQANVRDRGRRSALGAAVLVAWSGSGAQLRVRRVAAHEARRRIAGPWPGCSRPPSCVALLAATAAAFALTEGAKLELSPIYGRTSRPRSSRRRDPRSASRSPRSGSGCARRERI